MIIFDDIIKVRHTIKCECSVVFRNMGEWLDHKRETRHKKKNHVAYYAIGDEISLIKIFMEEKK